MPVGFAGAIADPHKGGRLLGVKGLYYLAYKTR
jgi:hypothetical protein